MVESLFNEVGEKIYEQDSHEKVVTFSYPEVNLKAIIAVHNTVLGPGLGGCRLRNYQDEAEALDDVLRLSEGMTYKSSLAGLSFGGAKACILIDPHFTEKRKELFQQFGKCIESLGGSYVSAEDMGTTEQDIEWMLEGTSFATGKPLEKGGAGDPSPWTALGVYQSMLAAAEKVYGEKSLVGKRISIQGVGTVGRYLIKHLIESKAIPIVADTHEPTLNAVASEFGVEVVHPDEIYDVECDFYSPCAIGQTVNKDTIPRLKCRIIAGAANNQLIDNSVYSSLEERDILYLPDFAINSGGVAAVGAEMNEGGWNEEWVREKTMAVYDTTHRIIEESEKRNLFPEVVAVELAKERIEAARSAAA